jgi:hypothetical protein
MTIFALSTASRIDLILAGAAVVWTGLAAMAASHGYRKGYPLWPLFISGFFLGFPLVLLAVTIGAGPQRLEPVATRRKGGLVSPGSESPRMLEELGQ